MPKDEIKDKLKQRVRGQFAAKKPDERGGKESVQLLDGMMKT